MSLTRRGFTVAELAVALVLAGIVGGAAAKTLRAVGRVQRQQESLLARTLLLQHTAIVLTAELESVAPMEGDLLLVTDSSMRYRAPRAVRFVCAIGDGELTLAAGEGRELRVDRDLLAVFVGDGWRTVNPSRRTTSRCPGGGAGWRIVLRGSPVVGEWVGMPAVVMETVEIRRYRDARGETWLGMASVRKEGGPAAGLQPLLGPFPPGRPVFAYRGIDGDPVGEGERVAAIEVDVLADDSMVPIRIDLLNAWLSP